MNKLALAALALWAALPSQARTISVQVAARGGRYQISEKKLALDMAGYRDASGSCLYMGWLDGGVFNVVAAPLAAGSPELGFSVKGPGFELRLEPFDEGYYVAGTIDLAPADLRLTRGPDGWRLRGADGAVELAIRTFDGGLELAGTADPRSLSPKGAAILAASVTTLAASRRLK